MNIGFWIGEGHFAQYAPTPPDPATLIHEGIITIGDWSNDGHGKYKMFKYTATHSRDQQQQAYLSAVEYFGLGFHGGYQDPNAICTEWKDNRVNAYHMSVLQKMAGISNTKFGDKGPMGFEPTPKLLAEMILWYLSLMLSGFKHSSLDETTKDEWYVLAKDKNETVRQQFWDSTLNGWWCRDLNEHFGYGVFDADNFYGTISNLRTVYSDSIPKTLKLIKQNSIRNGRMIDDCYEVRVEYFHPDLLTSNIHHTCIDVIELDKKLRKFIKDSEDSMFFAGNRIWFRSKKDAALFSLTLRDDFHK